MLTLEQRRSLMAVARGEAPADLVIRNGTVCNVYTGELWPAHVAVLGDRIADVGATPPTAREEWDARGRFLAPGLFEAHAHPQVWYNPSSLAAGVLPRGTTTLYYDDAAFVDCLPAADRALALLPGTIRWLARYGSPTVAGQPVEPLAPESVAARLSHPAVAAAMEFTRWPLLYRGESPYLEAHHLALAKGRRVEGHLSGASTRRLSALVSAGITSDHEPITAQQVVDRLRLGLWVMLRHSSLRPDLPQLLDAISHGGVDTSRLIFTTDGSTPDFICKQGFQDEMLRIAVQAGMDPVRALQMASRNPAVYMRAEDDLGGIAPGRRADLLVLPDLVEFRPERVMAGGRWVAENGRLTIPWPAAPLEDVIPPQEWAPPERFADHSLLPAVHTDGALFPVLELGSAVISRRKDMALPTLAGRVNLAGTDGLLYAALIDRLGRWIVRGVVQGLAPGLAGFATTANLARHLLVCGRDLEAMALSASRVAAMRGGAAMAESGQIIWELPLPLGGWMSDLPFEAVAAHERQMTGLLRERGYPHHSPVYTFLFLTLDSLPRFRVSQRGLYDVMAEKVVRPPEPLT